MSAEIKVNFPNYYGITFSSFHVDPPFWEALSIYTLLEQYRRKQLSYGYPLSIYSGNSNSLVEVFSRHILQNSHSKLTQHKQRTSKTDRPSVRPSVGVKRRRYLWQFFAGIFPLRINLRWQLNDRWIDRCIVWGRVQTCTHPSTYCTSCTIVNAFSDMNSFSCTNNSSI